MKSDTLAGIHKRSFNTPRPWSAKEIGQLLLRDSTQLITGKNSFLLGSITDCEAEILTLAVDPINRRLGIAKDLLKKFENICLQKNIDKIVLEVAKNNVPAIQLYKNCHYKTKGKRKNYYTSPEGEKVDAIVMIKSI